MVFYDYDVMRGSLYMCRLAKAICRVVIGELLAISRGYGGAKGALAVRTTI